MTLLNGSVWQLPSGGDVSEPATPQAKTAAAHFTVLGSSSGQLEESAPWHINSPVFPFYNTSVLWIGLAVLSTCRPINLTHNSQKNLGSKLCLAYSQHSSRISPTQTFLHFLLTCFFLSSTPLNNLKSPFKIKKPSSQMYIFYCNKPPTNKAPTPPAVSTDLQFLLSWHALAVVTRAERLVCRCRWKHKHMHHLTHVHVNAPCIGSRWRWSSCLKTPQLRKKGSFYSAVISASSYI